MYYRWENRRLSLLTEQAERTSALSREALAKAADLSQRAEKFLSLFDTRTDSPLDEIRASLAEYEVLSASLTRRRSEIERFAIANCITPAALGETEDEAPPLDTEGSILTIDSELLTLEGDMSAKKSAMDAASREIESRPALEERLAELTDKRAQYEENLSVIRKAKDLLGKAKTNMTARYLGSTTEGFCKYVSFIDGAASDFTMDTSFTVRRDDMGASRETASYSRGTKELYSLAVHLSLSDALYEGDLPPIILDDPFISFDDAHTERALSLIKKLSGERQILYFTCSKARKIK